MMCCHFSIVKHHRVQRKYFHPSLKSYVVPKVAYKFDIYEAAMSYLVYCNTKESYS